MGVVGIKTIVICDTREKADKKDHILKVFDQHGIPVIRHGLYVGDWTLLNDMSVCIDTKTGGMTEVYSNLVQDHDRFRRECKRAQDAGIQLVVLVEEKGIASLDEVRNWINPRAIIRQRKIDNGEDAPKAPPISSQRLEKIMRVMAENYGVRWEFCEKAQTGERILELLGVTHA